MTETTAAWLGLVLYAMYGALAVGLRILVQLVTSGDSGLRGAGGRVGSPEWWARLLFVVAVMVGAAAPVAQLLGLDSVFEASAARVAGLVISAAGILLTLGVQLAMGKSWRVGVDPEERTELVTGGPFRIVRNPIFTATMVTFFGLALLVPNWLAILGFALLVVALELQVRVVEEPYLLTAHEADYGPYAQRVGRFVPFVGRRRGPAS